MDQHRSQYELAPYRILDSNTSYYILFYLLTGVDEKQALFGSVWFRFVVFFVSTIHYREIYILIAFIYFNDFCYFL